MAPTVWARVVGHFAARAEAVGAPRAQLLSRIGLTDADLADPDGRLALETLYDLVEALVELSGDPLAHMRLTRTVQVEMLDALAFVVLTSPTLGAGLRAMVRYQRIFTEGERYELERDGDWARLVHCPWGPSRPAHALMSEMFAVDTLVNGAAMIGAPFDRPRVLLTGPPPRDRAAHRELLDGLEARFGAPRSEVWLRATDLERRLAPDGQEAMCAFFARHLEERIRALPPSSVAGTVRDALMRSAVTEPTMTALARRLHMSPRTLQRRLSDEGTSLRALLDETRRARAIPLLEGGHSIAEVAYILGYAEPSAFHRAFRRWTHRTPESFRAASHHDA